MTTSTKPLRAEPFGNSPDQVASVGEVDRESEAAPLGAGGSGAFQVLNIVVRHRRMVILTGLTIGLLAGVRAFLKPHTYTSETAFVPQAANPERTGVAGVAASFGFNVGGAAQTESPNFYADMLTSDEILRPVAAATYANPAASSPAAVPLAKILHLEGGDPETTIFKLEKTLRGMTDVTVNQRTGVVRVAVTTAYPSLSKQIADTLLASLNAFNLAGRHSRAAGDREFAEGRLEDYQGQLMATEREYEEFLSSNRVANSPALQLQRDRYQRRIAMLQQVVTSLTSTFEQARIDEVRSTPAIRVLQRPRIPVEPNARGTLKTMFLATAVGALLALVFAAAAERLRAARLAGDPALTEFLSTVTTLFRRRRRPSV